MLCCPIENTYTDEDFLVFYILYDYKFTPTFRSNMMPPSLIWSDDIGGDANWLAKGMISKVLSE
jgi:hypothetical protein